MAWIWEGSLLSLPVAWIWEGSLLSLPVAWIWEGSLLSLPVVFLCSLPIELQAGPLALPNETSVREKKKRLEETIERMLAFYVCVLCACVRVCMRACVCVHCQFKCFLARPTC